MNATATNVGDYQVTGRRILAALVDIALFAVVFLIMAAVFGDIGSEERSDGTKTVGVWLGPGPSAVFFLLIFVHYRGP